MSKHSHVCRLFYVPAEQAHQVRCIVCGEVVVRWPETQEFRVEGDCKPVDTLGFEAMDGVRADDRFGQ